MLWCIIYGYNLYVTVSKQVMAENYFVAIYMFYVHLQSIFCLFQSVSLHRLSREAEFYYLAWFHLRDENVSIVFYGNRMDILKSLNTNFWSIFIHSKLKTRNLCKCICFSGVDVHHEHLGFNLFTSAVSDSNEVVL